MARIISSSWSPMTSVTRQVYHKDGSIVETTYKEGETITNLRYVEKGEVKTITGRLDKVNYTNLNAKRKYGDILNSKTFFADDVRPDSLVIDSSTNMHSKITIIPCREIVEDADDTDVTRVKFYMSYGVTYDSKMSDDSTSHFDVWEGEDLLGLSFMDRGGDITVDCTVVAFTYDANLNPLTMIIRENARIRELEMIQLLGAAGVLVPEDTSEVNLEEVLASGGEIALTAGITDKVLPLNGDVYVRGAKAGVPAKNRVDAGNVDVEHETILSGTVKFTTPGKITLDGVVLEKDALISVKDCPEITLVNCIFRDQVAVSDNSFTLLTQTTEVPTLMTLKNCYFADMATGTHKIKNCLELNSPLADGSCIDNNYFEKNCTKNNIICLYAADEGATISASNNHFEYSANGIRVATKGNKTVTYNLNGNSYDSTIEEYPDYCGLLLIQPYALKTDSFEKNVININNTVHKDKQQLWYLYYQKSGDTKITPDKRPTVIVNGVVEMQPEDYVEPDPEEAGA